MARTLRPSPYRRCLAGALAALIGLGPLATPAYAQLTALDDQPLGAQVKAKPNIMLTVDDSSSMLYDFLPDTVIGRDTVANPLASGANNYCRNITGKMTYQCGLFDSAIDLSAAGRGTLVTPGYAFEQFGYPFPAYQSTIQVQTPIGLSAPVAIDNSGPGAGCTQLGLPTTTCMGGTDPGPSPGLERYPNPPGPPPAKSPKAGKVYEYWTLWPAPAHNSEVNHLYYNPRITYEPPLNADGSSYAQMNAGNTANWTKVPADPWATTITYVDLTAQVTIGMWCNSDWSAGHETDPRYCRTNGTGNSAPTATTASADGDYSYPWAPPGINPDDGVQPTTAKSIALSKVAFDPVNGVYTVQPAWANAQDPKYFYENDNILWCDPTNPLFPAQGTLSNGTCNSAPPTNQQCLGVVNQSCTGGTQSQCVGVTAQTCGGATPQTCGLTAQNCNNAVPQTCVAAPDETCQNIGDQHCGPTSPQTCQGSSTQTCGSLTHEACVGGGAQVCNIPPPACVAAAPDCGTYSPPGCNATCLPGDPECSCTFNACPSTCSTNPGQTCTSASDCPAPGHCSGNNQPCDSFTACPVLAGTCSPDGGSCSTSNDCPLTGTCLGSFCHPGDTCHQNGQCSSSGAPCTGLVSGECPDSGFCTLVTTQSCTDDSSCPNQNGTCSIHTATPCFADGQCLQPARCSGSGATCDTLGVTAECPDLNGVCNIDFAACTASPNTCVQAGHCSGPIGNVCHSASDCLPTGGQCSGPAHAPCDNVTTFCPDLSGTCDSGATTPPGGCLNSGMCPFVGARCSVDTGTPCNYQATDCPTHRGYCSGDPSRTLGVCGADSDCLPIPSQGTCQGFSSIICTANSDCPATGSDPAAAVCSDQLTGSTRFLNGNFESPSLPDYEYRPGEAGVGWTFVGGAGIQHDGGSWGAAYSGDGYQTAFIQNNGSMAQALVLNAGSYTLSFLAARRGGQLNPVQVTLDGAPIGALVAPVDANFASFSIAVTIATPGVHVFSFAGTNVSGDMSTFIDAVTIGGAGSMLSLLEDANGAGMVCRHNNQSYGAVTAAPYNYPNAQYNTPVSGGTGPNACTASPRYAKVARHYWKTGVEWCDTAVSSPGDAWLGYGSHDGTCQESSDTTHITPRFYQFGADPGCTDPDPIVCPAFIAPSAVYLDNYANPAFQRMDLNALLNPTFTHTFVDDSHTPQTIARAFGGATPDVSEMTNYANWFAYYRTRITAVKTVTSLVFNNVDTQYRVGFHTLFLDPSTNVVASFLNIADFALAQPGLFYSRLFGVTVPLGQQTPTLDAMVRIGEYYRTGTVATLPGSTDPITLSCQKNWHFLFTDGYTNQPGPAASPTPAGDADLTVPNYPGYVTDPIGGLVPGAAWPHPYQEDPTAPASNGLSDYAMQYWVTDLRPAMTDNVPTCTSPRSYTCVDPANWQHVNFGAISLGTSGKLPAGNPAITESLLASGALQWPQPTPSVNMPDISGVDDLWHAAVNARGDFINAQTPDDVKSGLGQLLQAALNSTGTRSGVGFLNNTFGPSGNFMYLAQFTPGWGGSLAKIQFDAQTGAPGAQQWDAADQLTAQLQVGPLDPQPWFSKRAIVTMNEAGMPVPFLWANLGPNQQNSLAPGKPALGQTIVEFLRGSRANEGIKLGQLRKRPLNTVLGDIVDSSPVYVGPPNWPYTDGNDPGYSAFRSALAGRAARIYVGANDGMLHAFDDATGNETWAYIPSPLYRGLTVASCGSTTSPAIPCGTPSGDLKTGLGALSYQDGALPPFRHHFYVDSTPRVVDVDFNAPTGDGWHSILVGGLGKGGNRYYALDVTNPVSAGVAETTAAANVLWEFPAPGDTATDMGYSYGKPFIAKTRAFGGEWLVVVPSGYDNPSGIGKLYFLRARDGHLEFSMSTGFGSSGAPAGLAQAAGYTQDFRNQLLEQIYAGDLFGNLWRFDVSDPNPANWTVGQLAQLVDANGVAQPVTTPPEIKIDPSNGVDRWIFVGTGRLLDDSDLTTPAIAQQETLYAIRDGTDTTPVTPLPVPALSRSTLGMVAIPHGSSINNFGLAAKPDKGWFDDLPTNPNQRIVVPPQAAAGVIGYIGTSPQIDPCLTGLPATVYAREYATGQSVLIDPLGGVDIVESAYSATGGVGIAIVSFEPPSGAVGLDVRVAITGFNGQVSYYKVKLPASANKYRMSWRLLGQ
jgi:type IV pilus assembly protein PilY1